MVNNAEEQAIETSKAAKAKKIEEQEEVKRSDVLKSIQAKFPNLTNETKNKIKEWLTAEGYAKLTDPNVPVKLLQTIDAGI